MPHRVDAPVEHVVVVFVADAADDDVGVYGAAVGELHRVGVGDAFDARRRCELTGAEVGYQLVVDDGVSDSRRRRVIEPPRGVEVAKYRLGDAS